MLLTLGSLVSEELDRVVALLQERGFRVVSSGRDPESDGECEVISFDYEGHDDLTLDNLQALIRIASNTIKDSGQSPVVRSTRTRFDNRPSLIRLGRLL